MALNFELVISNQLFSIVLASCKRFKISAPGVVTAGYSTLQFKFQSCDVIGYFNDVYKVKISFVKVACA